MKIFVTGATGFLGYHFVNVAVSQGHEVLCLKRPTSKSLFEPIVEEQITWVLTVWEVATAIINNFGFGELKDVSDPNALHEANLLMLNINKAKTRLGWTPRLNAKETAVLTSDWYKRYKTENVYDLCVEEINKFLK